MVGGNAFWAVWLASKVSRSIPYLCSQQLHELRLWLRSLDGAQCSATTAPRWSLHRVRRRASRPSVTRCQFCCDLELLNDLTQTNYLLLVSAPATCNDNAIVNTRLRPRCGADPGEPVWEYATKSNSCCHLASHFEYTHLASPVPGHYDIASTKPETRNVSQRCRKGSNHVPICTENLVKYGLAVPVICAQTDTHTDRQTRSLQYFASYWGGVIRIKHDSNWVLPPRA